MKTQNLYFRNRIAVATKAMLFISIVLLFGLSLVNCSNGMDSLQTDTSSPSQADISSSSQADVSSSSQIDVSSSSQINISDPSLIGEALRAKPVAASNSEEPKILDSWKKEDRNYYIIYAGKIQNTFISEIAYVHYIGFPMGFSKTTVTGKTITNSITEVTSNSIVFSNSSQNKLTLEAEMGAKLKIVGFSVGLKLEESMTTNVTSSQSTETSIDSLISTVESEANTISFEIGNRGEAVGHYRYSLYDISDIYFVISTDLDNDALLSWEVISCARDSYLRRWEYSLDGNFDNSPLTGSEIVFAEDFHKKLPKPTKTIEESVFEKKEFTKAGDATYTYNGALPATVEIYALGSGGGGQGGHRKDRGVQFSKPDGDYSGTGGAGGGGAAAYIKFSLTEPTTFDIKVGSGGNGGSGKYSSYTSAWQPGNKGSNGGTTSINWDNDRITVEGGLGGGETGTAGGASGQASNTTWPMIYLETFADSGYKGSDGNEIEEKYGDINSSGGNAASINKGSLNNFGGGLGAVKGTRNADFGGGGYGGYNNSGVGSKGGDGKVIIVITK